MRILIIDNNDSFTRNLEHLLAVTTGARVEIAPYAHLSGTGLPQADLLVLSPGPGRPADYPAHQAAIGSGLPVLGICLGMQAINEHFGGTTQRLPGCMHGKTETIDFMGRPWNVARYHSLYCATIGQGLDVIAANDSGVPMALSHRSLPLAGYQFHPESFLTENGGELIDHALRILGLA